MSGKFILVEIDDDTEADAFVEHIDERDGELLRVIGIYLRPDDFCEHGNWVTMQGHPPITQMYLEKVGWRLCTQCMKPVPDMGFLKNQRKLEDVKKPWIVKILGKDRTFRAGGLGLYSNALGRRQSRGR